jgi:putative oxidoreductase
MKNFFKSNAGYGMTALRLMLGIVFFAHGAQKLFGMFGGYGLEGTGKFFASIGLNPGYAMAALAGGGEFIGGILLILGLFSRLAALNTLVISLVGLFTVHLANGFFMSANGFEYILTLAMASVAIIIEGSGKLSLDKVLSTEENN